MQQEQHQLPRKLRVLCLHSWRTSGAIFKQQFRRVHLDVALADLIDFVFITAPEPASGPIPEDVAGTFEGPYFEWFTTEKAQDGQELVFTYHHILESEAFIMAKIRELGPFDGVCGFSQGGAMASIMVALQRAGLALQDVPPFKFVLFFGSVLTTHPRYLPAFRERVQVPSCHIIGHKDYVKEHAIALARNFEAPIVIMHSRGHIVPPLLREQLAVLRAFLVAMQDVPQQAARVQEGQQQQTAAAVNSSKLDPLEPPQPIWETEAEQVQQQISGKQQEQQQQEAALEMQRGLQQRPKYVQRIKLSGKIPGDHQASKL